MLKFSGFADLTSCLESNRPEGQRLRESGGDKPPAASEQKRNNTEVCLIRRQEPPGASPYLKCVKGPEQPSDKNHKATGSP